MALNREKASALAGRLTNLKFPDAKYRLDLINADTDYDPSTGLSTGGSSQSLSATLTNFKQSQFDGDNIKIGDKLVIIVNSELNINIINNSTSFELYLGNGGGGVSSGRVISTQIDPYGVITKIQLRS